MFPKVPQSSRPESSGFSGYPLPLDHPGSDEVHQKGEGVGAEGLNVRLNTSAGH